MVDTVNVAGTEPKAPPVSAPPAAPDAGKSAAADPFKDFEFSEGLPGVLVTKNKPDLGILPTMRGADPAPEGGAPEAGAAAAAAAASAVTTGTTASASTPAPAPAKVKVGKYEFETYEAAGHRLATLEGQYKAREARELAAIQRAQQAEIELLKLRSAPQPTPTPTPEAPKAPVADVFKVYETLKATLGEEAAFAYLQDQNEKRFSARLEEKVAEIQKGFDDRLAKYRPVEEMVQQNERSAVMQDLAETLGTYTLPNGDKAFPELFNAEDAVGIRAVVDQYGLDDDYFHTPKGLVSGIMLYRQHKALQAAMRPQPQPAPVPVPVPSASPVSAGSDGASGRGPRTPVVGEDIVDRITKAPLRTHADFGFSVNR